MNFLAIITSKQFIKTITLNEMHYDGKYYYIHGDALNLKNNIYLPIIKENDTWKIESVDLPSDLAEITLINDCIRLSKTSTSTSVERKYSDFATAAYNDKKLIEKDIEDGDVINVHNYKTRLDFCILFRNEEKINQDVKLYKRLKNSELSCGLTNENKIVVHPVHTLIKDSHFKFGVNAKNIYSIMKIGDNPIYVNGMAIDEKELVYGDVIELYDYKIIYLVDYVGIIGDKFEVNEQYFEVADLFKFYSLGPKNNSTSIKYEKAPRIISNYDRSDIALQLPPDEATISKTPAILAIGPSLTMSLGSVVTLVVTINNYMNGGSKSTLITSAALTISMLLGAILWPILNRRYQAQQQIKANEKRSNKYKHYIARMRSEIEAKNLKNLETLDKLYLSPEEIYKNIGITENKENSLFNRQIGDADFLKIRIGNGTIPTDLNLTIPPKEFTINDDELKDEIYEAYNELKDINNAPFCLSLMDNQIVGVSGDDKNKQNIIKEMIMSLTYSHSYDDVKTIFIFNSSLTSEYSWCYSLKSSSSDSQNERFICTNQEEVHNLMLGLKEMIDERIEEDKDECLYKPYYVFFIFSTELIKDESLFNKLLNSKYIGFSFVYCVNKIAELPSKCNTIIESKDDKNYFYHRDQINGYTREFNLDTVDEGLFKGYIDYISRVNIKFEEKVYNVPEKISFLEMYKVGNIRDLNIYQRWQENRTFKNIKALIGIKSGGENVYLDMHEQFHGPHGLAAGMTGSGKSEFLQTLILSLALNYSPEEVNFILIDFKGGGMANLFNGLPHLVGKMTNLSGSELNRSMVSIESVIQERQQLFKEYSNSSYQINHIDKYQKLYRQNKNSMKPMPHLIIIADEFAQLKAQHPEFMNKLIDIAQIGRSLGIHLLLATQKPAGLVSDQIWSNSKFKVCLKVLDKQDSVGMIKKPDAALINLPGRCYLQVGYDEIYEYFQSGYSGTPYEESDKFIEEELNQAELIDNTGTRLGIVMKKNNSKYMNKDYTQLRALVEAMKGIGLQFGYEEKPLWLPPMPKIIGINELTSDYNKTVFDGKGWFNNEGLKTIMCKIDDLKGLEQRPLEIDLTKNIGIVGSQGTGKFEFIQSLVYDVCTRYTPSHVNIDILDFETRGLNCFRDMPHIGKIAFVENDGLVEEILTDYRECINERKIEFEKYGVSSLEEYNAESDYKLPYRILIIHNYTSFYEEYLNQQERLLKIIREANNYGISIIISGINRNAFNKTNDLLKQKFVLNLNDKTYYDFIKRVGTMVPEDYLGRGLVEVDGEALEFQTALVGGIESSSARTKYIREVAEKMNFSFARIVTEIEKEEEKEEIDKANMAIKLGKISGNDFYLDYNSFNTLVMVSNDDKGFDKYINLVNKFSKRDNTIIYQFNMIDKTVQNAANVVDVKINEMSKMLEEIKSNKNKNIVINIMGFYKFISEIEEDDYIKLNELLKNNETINLLIWDIETNYFRVKNWKRFYYDRKMIAIINDCDINLQHIFDNALPVEPKDKKFVKGTNYVLLNKAIYKMITL